MNLKHHILLFAACLLLGVHATFGQNEEDALRFSSLLPGGTARSWALGGAIGAVGADPGSITTNPAGLGLYNTSEVSFTPQFEVNTAKSTHYGLSTSDNDNRFSFNNLSLILSYPSEAGKAWRGGVFGLSLDRQASFHWEEHAKGVDVPSTILQKFVNEANGISPADLETSLPFTSDLAYMTYGIDPLDTTANTYRSAVPFGTAIGQDHMTSTAGRLNTTSFFYAGNYMDRLYLGASIGFTGLRYQREMTHAETMPADTSFDMESLAYKEHLLTTGNGIDLKVGVLARAGKNVRLGLAFQSPKWLQMSDSYAYDMSTEFRSPDSNGDTQYALSSPDGTFNYRIRTPWSVLASAAFVAGQHGLVSVDYAYTDFRQSKLNKSSDLLDPYDFSKENAVLNNSTRATHSLRVGTEWRAGAWYFRAGWGIWPDAYAESDPRHGTAYKRYTAGIGYRTGRLSVDFTAVHGTRDTSYFQYDPSLVQATNVRLNDTRGMLTLAFRP